MNDGESMFEPARRALPTQTESLEGIKKEAPRAIRTLKKNNATDLAEMLGLTPYLKGAN